MKYLKKFDTIEDFHDSVNSGNLYTPNVSHIHLNGVVYTPLIPESFILLDQNITDPTQMITGQINGSAIRLIRKNSHRYLGKYTASGTMTLCQLDDTDSTKYVDGTSADLTGADGDVFMKLPRFAYKAEEIESDKWKISFHYGDAPDTTWEQWDDNELIGVFEACSISNKLYSHSGVVAVGNISQPSSKSNATSRGTGFSLIKLKHHNIMAFLFYAMYGNANSQSILGAGTNSYDIATGGSSVFGMADTIAGVNDEECVNFWGLENWLSLRAEWLDNVTKLLTAPTLSIQEDDGSIRNIHNILYSNGYISKIVIGKHLDVVPKALNASGTTGFCDYYQNTASDNINDGYVMRTHTSNTDKGGIAALYILKSNGNLYQSFGARIAFRGTLIEESNPETFKTLTAIG